MEQKFPFIFVPGTKVPWSESSQERMFPTGNFRSRERKYRRAKRPITGRVRWKIFTDTISATLPSTTETY